MRSFLCVVIVFFISINSFSQKDTSSVKLNNPATLHKPGGYSHTAEINLGTCTMVIISGQVPLDSKGNLVGKNDLIAQAEQVFRNIQLCVESAGGNMNNIVKLNYYLTDASQVQKVRDARDKFIDTAHPPASTLVQVARLFREDVLLEVEATAIIPHK
jgi:enamine deaminase RidA (YjgF/YER057c/UK114 family)